ncbi:RrF2 family transcriptional regulator [Aliarcobacter vitoriensis]|uniref:Transcriptional regulator n=1 Tax=Aliarcobacter vitoriensis TaxID=2011099 RepID=A0A366MRD4_9BACT|nr:Rrf2 family transcriptional regulator [Aliarcobacter vitoriensis]RBQ28851.1 transcriptional regulator [Aliarcobacter vitoriensis]RBQ31102.1 transcriptional regulator [Arcobacter sp. FW59]
MIFSTTSKYAIKVLLHMSKNTSKLYSVKELSEILEIPYKYLSKIMTNLSKKDLILAIQGRYGGFKLAKNEEDIKLKDILIALEDESFKQCVLGDGICDKENKCKLHDTWDESKQTIQKSFLELNLIELK